MPDYSDEWGGRAIKRQQDNQANGQAPRLCLVFAPGTRPSLAALAALADQDGEPVEPGEPGEPGEPAAAAEPAVGAFAVSHRGPAGDWAELLCHGLTFDCTGLMPGADEPQPPAGMPVGLRSMPAGEVIALTTGPHLAGGAGLLPVLRSIAALGARLAALPGVQAVVWTPAAAWVAPDLFRRSVAEWLAGGAFPGLVLTALERERNGALVSRGLHLLTGQEVRFEPDKRLSPAAMARLAVRLIHELVQSGPLMVERDFTGPAGERLLAVPVRAGAQIRILISDVGNGQ